MDEEMLSQGDTVQDAGSPMNVSVNEQDQSGTEVRLQAFCISHLFTVRRIE